QRESHAILQQYGQALNHLRRRWRNLLPGGELPEQVDLEMFDTAMDELAGEFEGAEQIIQSLTASDPESAAQLSATAQPLAKALEQFDELADELDGKIG